MREVLPLYAQISRCQDCGLPEGYRATLRPPGPDYRPGGVVFVQINPGSVGFLSDEEIKEKYSTPKNREIANRKAVDTRYLLSLQEQFLGNPSEETYKPMRDGFLNSMSRLWGWPPGKYRSTIEAHGVRLYSAAVLNVAQCPVPDNTYRLNQLDRCWSKWTSRMLLVLRPALVVAQGRQVWAFLQHRELPAGAKIVEGLHHADRRSREVKERLLSTVRDTVRMVT